MKKIAVVTDSNSGFLIEETQGTNLFVIPMPFIINGEEYLEEIDLSQDQFYEKLANNENVSTSQPSPGVVLDMWEKVLKDFDEIIHIPMSSGLSESCNTAKKLAEDYPNVYVVDNQRISVTQKQSCLDALQMIEKGFSSQEIVDYLMKTKKDSSIYITVATLKYLKKGGRVTPAAAALGTVLNIKPVLQIQGEKLDSYAKVLSMGMAKSKMINAIKSDIENRFKNYYDNDELMLDIAYTHNYEEALKFKAEVEKAIPNLKVAHVNPLSLSVSSHIGPGALAVAVSRVYK